MLRISVGAMDSSSIPISYTLEEFEYINEKALDYLIVQQATLFRTLLSVNGLLPPLCDTGVSSKAISVCKR
ncbi:unnamed protein product [Angiostrongylus costaricensis]|uniref:Uncharacterized protein n=1 Tax=Angiostrongylus costaricensis TaxID=334426 RepID=A0A0R3PKW2_ANGCS|nr:unnamed protein product [Angiostrongylus costaricensis]